jgi:hypothetical protein
MYTILLGVLLGVFRLDVDLEMVCIGAELVSFVLGIESVEQLTHIPLIAIGSADTSSLLKRIVHAQS